MRTDIEVLSGGLTCRGWLYRPDAHPTAQPGIVMATGFSGVKDVRLQPFAERCGADGFAVLLFDFRHLGAKDGGPRGHVLAHTQLDDLRTALDFLSTQAGVDADSLALWRTSYGGGHAPLLGALDPRVKAVTPMVPALGLVRTDATAGRLDLRQFAARADAFWASSEQPTVPVVTAGNKSLSGGGVHTPVRTDPSSHQTINASSSGGGVTVRYSTG
jgi:dienelactone hydrolase